MSRSSPFLNVMRRARRALGKSVTIDPAGPQIIAAYNRLTEQQQRRVAMALWSIADAAEPWKRQTIFEALREAVASAGKPASDQDTSAASPH